MPFGLSVILSLAGTIQMTVFCLISIKLYLSYVDNWRKSLIDLGSRKQRSRSTSAQDPNGDSTVQSSFLCPRPERSAGGATSNWIVCPSVRPSVCPSVCLFVCP